MKKAIAGLLFIMLIFVNCRRKSSTPIAASSQNDTTEIPPGPPGSVQDSTNQGTDTTVNIVAGFTFIPQKENLEAGNIGIVYKENNENILIVNLNICGGNDVFGVTFDLDYDSSKVKFKKLTTGGFLSKDGAATNIMFNIPHVGISRLGSEVPGVSGDGVICIMELEAKEKFDSMGLGFKNQNAENKELIEVLPSDNWFGGIISYK